MKIHCNATLISSLLLSVALIGLIPASLHFALTWNQLYEIQRLHIENLRMIIGFYSLGFSFIGLMVIWNWFRKKERWAWFVMLAIVLFFIFPGYVLRQIVLTYELKLQLSDMLQLLQYALAGNAQGVGIVMGWVTFLVMLIALLIPVKAFFGKTSGHNTVKE